MGRAMKMEMRTNTKHKWTESVKWNKNDHGGMHAHNNKHHNLNSNLKIEWE